MTAPTKVSWKVFWDLQCPYSKVNWERLDEIQQRFGDRYEFSIHLTSLLFHPQAFPAQCAANLIGKVKGAQAKLAFVNACFAHQDRYLNAAVGDARPSEVVDIFVSIAKEASLLNDENLTEQSFREKIKDWEEAVKPAYNEHKEALAYGVYGTPKFVIDEKLVPDTESSWGPDEWAKKLEEL